MLVLLNTARNLYEDKSTVEHSDKPRTNGGFVYTLQLINNKLLAKNQAIGLTGGLLLRSTIRKCF
ncbi:hypothetical protein SAMN05421690_100168 [Nitrosomonas sp. Nm51]|nr:hypothetical protein SAMN05421690_100168 [Nitrosomonas sp. Nm51]